MNSKEARFLLEKQFTEGRLPKAEADALRESIARSPSLRAEYNRYVELERTLDGDRTPSAQIDRILERGAPEVPRSSRQGWLRFAPVGLMALAASMALIVLTRPSVTERSAFTARSAGGEPAWIKIYRTDGQGKATPEPLRKSMHRGDGLLLSYQVLQSSSHRYLAIMARDAQGRVHWMYPAYRDAKESPRSIRVEPRKQETELPDMILMKPALGKMRICGLFTDAAMDIKSIDRRLEEEARWPTKGFLSCQEVTVRE